MRRPLPLAAILALLAAVAAVAFWIRVESDPYRLPGADWRVFKARFVAPDGRVIDTGNGGITHSEGQGYGMLLAEAFRDRRTFDRIWEWTRRNLQTRPDDRLLSWLWKPAADGSGAVADPNNASDGEILVAWALLKAFDRWGDYAYQQAAVEILADVRRLLVVETPNRLALLPGLHGFNKNGQLLLNPSYYVFPAFRSFEKKLPGAGWGALADAGHRLLEEARFGRWSLNPDWVTDVPPLTLKSQFPPDFGYNAIRIPLHVAWEDPASELLGPCAKFWRAFDDLSKMPATVNLETNALSSDPALPGMQAIARFAIAAADGRRLTVRDIPAVDHEEPYYSASLKLLTKVAIREAMGGKN